MIVFEREIIGDQEIIMIKSGRDLDLKKDLKLSKDIVIREWQEKTLVSLKRMGCDLCIAYRAINMRYDLDRGGARLLRRHLTITDQMYLYEKIWNLLK